jgi:hypothetical protein
VAYVALLDGRGYVVSGRNGTLATDALAGIGSCMLLGLMLMLEARSACPRNLCEIGVPHG